MKKPQKISNTDEPAAIDVIGTDASKWADAFVKIVETTDGDQASADFKSLAVQWFEAAIGAGYAKGQADLSDAVAIKIALIDPKAPEPELLAADRERVRNDVLIEHAGAIKLYEGVTAFANAVVGDKGAAEHYDNAIREAAKHGFMSVAEDTYVARGANISSLIDATGEAAADATLKGVAELAMPETEPFYFDQPIKIGRDAWDAHVEHWKAEGAREHLRAGLNADHEGIPLLDLGGVNAVDLFVADDGGLTLTADGRIRVTAASGVNIVIVRSPTDRWVVRAPGVVPDKGDGTTGADIDEAHLLETQNSN